MTTSGHCAVCNSKFLPDDPKASCPKCEVPYHEDCWDHNEAKCAIYGCGGVVGEVVVHQGLSVIDSRDGILLGTSSIPEDVLLWGPLIHLRDGILLGIFSIIFLLSSCYIIVVAEPEDVLLLGPFSAMYILLAVAALFGSVKLLISFFSDTILAISGEINQGSTLREIEP